jgi:iron complex outermembrane receptor protein
MLAVLLGASLAERARADQPDSRDRKLLKELEEKEDLEEEGERGSLEDLLDRVVVTATKRAQPISAAPAIISVITDKQIRQRGYRSVAEALSSLPGLYLLTDHVQPNLGVRGINGGTRAGSRIVKVMIDGQPVSFRPSTENWLGEELIPVSAVRRIEIIRGPSSALYGANAFLGVINIITTSGAIVDGARISGSVGAVRGNAAGGGELVVGTRSGSTDVLVSGTGSFADRSGIQIRNVPGRSTYQAPGDATLGDTTTPASLFVKLLHTSQRFGTLSLDLSYQRLHSRGELADWGPLPQGGQLALVAAKLQNGIDREVKNQISLQNLYVRARLSRTFLENLRFGLSGTFSMMGPTSLDRLALAQKGIADWVTRDLGTQSFDLVSEVSYTARGVNTFTLGVDLTSDHHQLLNYYYWTRSAAGLAATSRPEARGTKSFLNLGTYLQSVVYPTVLLGSPHLTSLGLTLGLRYDHHNIYGDALNFRAGAVYLWRKLSAKILFGTSFKAPAAVQLYTMLLQPGDVLANPDLRPERAKTLEIQLGSALLAGLHAELTFYYSMVDDKVEIATDPRSSNLSAQNIARIRGYGFEGEAAYTWRNLTSYLNASYQRTTSTETNPLSGGEESFAAALYPSFMLKLGVGYQIPRIYLGAFAEARLITSRLSSAPNSKVHDPVEERPYALDPYFTLDLSLHSVELRLFRGRETFLQARIQNLTGAEYLYPGFRNFDIPALGRTFFFSLTQQI